LSHGKVRGGGEGTCPAQAKRSRNCD
jgi:hypothetical protein